MAYREKSAWISLLIMLAVYGYTTISLLAAQAPDADKRSEMLGVIIGATIIVVVLEIVMQSIAAARQPKEAQAPADEREKLIELKSTRIAFVVLMTGALFAVFAYYAGYDGFVVSSTAFGAVVIAQILKFASEIAYFRFGVG
jgi:heme/copper-type cytochrome/quinol oxidase subunit 2